ncbi:MAG TPA: OmpA family protein, partial [Bacteroidia bacterium]
NLLSTAIVDKDGKFHFTTLPSDESVLFKLESYDVLVVNEVTVGSGNTNRIVRRGADGFFHYEKLTAEQNQLGKMDVADTQIKLKAEEAKAVMNAMTSLEFDFGKENLRPASLPGLDVLAGLMKDHPDWRLKLSGHTDNVSSMQFNMKLSQKRVEAIRDYLVKKKGIDAKRFVLKWYGPTKPIASNATEDGKQKNRRVEFLVIK